MHYGVFHDTVVGVFLKHNHARFGSGGRRQGGSESVLELVKKISFGTQTQPLTARDSVL